MSEQLARGADHHDSTPARVSRSLGAAVKYGSDRWEEAFWSSNRASTAVVPRRKNVVWTEQGELWDGGPVAAKPVAAANPAPAKLVRAAVDAPHPRARTKPATRAPAVARKSMGATGSYAQKHNSVRTADIARYLQVNSAVNGVVETSWFKLPRRTFTAAYEHALWKGREVGTPFVKGC